MNTIMAIIIGALLWQTIAAAICIITNENEDIVLAVAFGMWAIIFRVAALAVRSIRLAYSRRYNCYQIYGKSKPGFDNPCHWWITNVYMTPKVAAKYRTVEKCGYEYAIKLLRTGKEFKSYPLKQDIIKDGDIFPCMSKDFYENFLDRG